MVRGEDFLKQQKPEPGNPGDSGNTFSGFYTSTIQKKEKEQKRDETKTDTTNSFIVPWQMPESLG